ncbi:hypothetical protein GCM10028773_42090 [Spirosoma koreense]
MYDIGLDPQQKADTDLLMAFFHYGLAVWFSIDLSAKGYFKYRQETYTDGRHTRWLCLLLWLISAYALNRTIPVFQQSTGWLCWALVAVGLAMAGYAWKEFLSVRAQQLLYAALAFGWWLFAYMAIYVIELYIISVPMLVGLGLSIHSFVPLAFAISLGKRLWQDTRREEHLRLGVVVGFCLPIIALSVFLVGWTQTRTQIERTKQQAIVRKTSDLPDWVLIAQRLKPGWITDRFLLSNQVYDQGSFFDGGSWIPGTRTSLDDVRWHDPLVVIASRLFPTNVLSDKEQLSVFKTISADRHNTEEKFWTGRHLTTEEVVSQVRIWPQYRLSYTEKTIRIRNEAHTTTEEALLTFQLSPGSVVSSMSLWVNGQEQPAYLTTVAKADSAYRTVVAVESRRAVRDPSVVYWQEGNRVTVRVFPCRAGDDRRVKLGITSPLQLDNDVLIYQTPSFEGPDASHADELIQVDFDLAPAHLKSPWLFDRLTDRALTHQGRYDPDWSLRFLAPALSTGAFVLGQEAYQMAAYRPAYKRFQPTDVFLDINSEWSADEVKAVYEATTQAGAKAWVFLDGLQPLTSQNMDDLYAQLKQQSFSLFPVYRITQPATALLVTKGTTISPSLSDLRDSRFADHFSLLAKQTASIHTFSLQSQPASYLKSLAELRVLTVMQGTRDDLTKRLLETHQFIRQSDQANWVILPEAGVGIRKTQANPATASVAPDHLARLFSYNRLLADIGRHYFVKNYQTDKLIQEAQRAHVVSPLSSLIVLESDNDYNRFGIKKDHAGLDNATLKEEGAVPEPHEWALLIMVLGLIGWLFWQKRYAVH